MRKFGRGDFLKSILAASGLSAFGSSKVFAESKPLPTLGFNPGLGTLPILTAARPILFARRIQRERKEWEAARYRTPATLISLFRRPPLISAKDGR